MPSSSAKVAKIITGTAQVLSYMLTKQPIKLYLFYKIKTLLSIEMEIWFT